MRLDKILEKKELEGRDINNKRIEKYSERPHSLYPEMGEEDKKKLIKILNEIGFTQEEIEEKIGTSLDYVIYTAIPEYRKKRFRKRKWKSLRIARKEDAVEIDWGGYKSTRRLTMLREVYEVEPGTKYSSKHIWKKKGVKSRRNWSGCCARGYVLNEEGEIEEKNLWKPSEDMEKELKRKEIEYKEYRESPSVETWI